MPEAEDVLLHAAEQVTAVVRGLWLRHRPSAELPGIALVEASRRLSLVLQACLGRIWPILPSDADPTPTWLAKRLRKLPPWAHGAHAPAYTDGCSLFLPRHLQAWGDAVKDEELLRLIALVLAARLARGSVQHCPLEPVARDLFWAIDGTITEALLAAQLPGLAPTIAAVRRCTLASRPTPNALTPRERAVEQIIQHLLHAAPGDVRGVGPAVPASLAWSDAVAARACHLAGHPPFHSASVYHGIAPVLHWGRPRPDLVGFLPPTGRLPEDTGRPRPPARVQAVAASARGV